MNYITFSYDNTRSKGFGWLFIGAAFGCAFIHDAYWLAGALFAIGIALDTRVKRSEQ